MEGGGQIIRTSIALAAITGKEIQIANIRANRPNPGLRRQHIIGIEAVAKIADTEIEKLNVGTTRFDFHCHSPKGGKFHLDVGTAGAISLVIQTILPVALWAENGSKIELRGGTDVKWSPPIDYMRQVVIPIFNKLLGIKIELDVIQRGHYPRGGGKVVLKVPSLKSKNFEINLDPIKETGIINGISHCVRLPSHVAERQAQAAKRFLETNDLPVQRIDIESYLKSKDPHHGPGSGIVLWAKKGDFTIVGSDSLGEPRIKAEKVGEEAALKLEKVIRSGAQVDKHFGDMLVPYMFLSQSSSHITVSEVTSHLITNLEIARKFINKQFNVSGSIGETGKVSCS